MFAQLISKIVKSAASSGNRLDDGTYSCTYRELPEIFAALDLFFSNAGITAGACSVLRCGNSLPEALVLLWMLDRKRDVFLLPREGLGLNLPEDSPSDPQNNHLSNQNRGLRQNRTCHIRCRCLSTHQ